MANRRFVQSARKRIMSWRGVAIDLPDITVVTPLFSVVLSEAAIEEFPTPTLVRTRGGLSAWTDTSSSPGAFGSLVVGIMQVNSAAVTGTAVPAPITDIGTDWLYWDVFHVGAAAGDVIGEEITVDRKTVDSKAMRKLKNNSALILVAQLSTCEGTMVVNLCGAMRFLLKAP